MTQRLRATVIKVSREARFGLVKIDERPFNAFVGFTDVTNADGLRLGDTVWADVTQDRGRWRARNVTVI